MKRICAVVFCVCLCEIALSQPRVVDIKLAAGVENSEAVNPFGPPLDCSSAERPEVVPVVNSRTTPQVYLWTKVNSDGEGTIRHVYYVDNDYKHFEETEYSWKDSVLNFIRRIVVTIGFDKIATITLPVGNSSTWRTWSAKKLSQVHRGEWKAEVSVVDADPTVLCTVWFRVE